jgi:lipopolysaccharide/colanic/teichoic acid biosynthesis glycosyltransferase
MAKRVFDVLVSLCAIVVLAPLLIAITAWVKIDSKGPALFCQKRVGRHGRTFKILKFRTMCVGASAEGPQITIGNDSRITRAGSILRRHKLDELPQFFNVLRGEMSVVGPRPEVPRYFAFYSERQQETILSIRPGITDSASVEFRNESALLGEADDPEYFYTQVILPAKLEQAEHYVRTHTLLGDARIILCTIAALARAPDSNSSR